MANEIVRQNRSFTPGVEPSSLPEGQLAVNAPDKKIWIGDEFSVPRSILSDDVVNVQSDWDQTSTGADDYIKNKPAVGGAVQVENELINGNFDIWQRGENLHILNGFFADRWKILTDTNNTINLTKHFSENKNHLNVYILEAEQTIQLSQRILGSTSAKYFGNKVTVSIQVKPDVAIGYYFQLELPGTMILQSTTFNVTAGVWQKLVYTFDVPYHSVTADDHVDLSIITDQSTHDGNYRYYDAAIYVSDIELPVRKRNVSEELQLCEAYYQKSYNSNDAPGAITVNGQHTFRATSGGNYMYDALPTLLVTMISIPAVTCYSPYSGNAGTLHMVDTPTGDAPCTVGVQSNSVLGKMTSTSTLPIDTRCCVHWTAEAEI